MSLLSGHHLLGSLGGLTPDGDFFAEDFTGTEWIDRVSGFGIDQLKGNPVLDTRGGVDVVVFDGDDGILFEEFSLDIPFTIISQYVFAVDDTAVYGNWRNESPSNWGTVFASGSDTVIGGDFAKIGGDYITLRGVGGAELGMNAIAHVFPDVGNPTIYRDGALEGTAADSLDTYINSRTGLGVYDVGGAPPGVSKKCAINRWSFFRRALTPEEIEKFSS